MLGGMAETRDDAPALASDSNYVVGEQAPVGAGQLRNTAPVLIAARTQRTDVLGVEAMRAKERTGCLEPIAAVLPGNRVGREVFGLRHRQRAAESIAQPGGVSEVIGMVVRGDDSGEHSSREGTCKMLFPQRARRRIAVPTIYLPP